MTFGERKQMVPRLQNDIIFGGNYIISVKPHTTASRNSQ